jgi:hypothetical protein
MQLLKSIVQGAVLIPILCSVSLYYTGSVQQQVEKSQTEGTNKNVTIDDIIRSINDNILDHSTSQKKYKINASNYGFMWWASSQYVNLLELPQQKKYSNEVYATKGIAVYKKADEYSVWLYYPVLENNDFKSHKLAVFKNTEDAKQLFDDLCALRDLAEKQVKRFKLEKRYYAAPSLEQLIADTKVYIVSAEDKKADCHTSSVLKKASIYISGQKTVYYEMVFNQPSPSLEYGVKNLEDFKVFYNQYEFDLRDITGIVVDPINVFRTKDNTFEDGCRVGVVNLYFKEKNVKTTSKTRHDNKWAKVMGRSIDNTERLDKYVTIYFDNSKPYNARMIADNILMASLTVKD